jgi:hypothetical protein
MTFAKWTLSAAALLAAVGFAAPASAQTQSAAGDMGSSSSGMPGINLGGGDKTVDEGTLQKRREIENAYKNATRSAPAQATAVNDPWANMRGAEEAKPAAKPAPKTAQKKKPAQ